MDHRNHTPDLATAASIEDYIRCQVERFLFSNADRLSIFFALRIPGEQPLHSSGDPGCKSVELRRQSGVVRLTVTVTPNSRQEAAVREHLREHNIQVLEENQRRDFRGQAETAISIATLPESETIALCIRIFTDISVGGREGRILAGGETMNRAAGKFLHWHDKRWVKPVLSLRQWRARLLRRI